MQIVYEDADIVVCIKPARVLSTDEPGGLPDLLREALGTADFRTVHRLDRVVSGLMVVARNAVAASGLSAQIREGRFEKEYLAVVHGCPAAQSGRFCDLLLRDKTRKMTMVVQQPGQGTQSAALRYEVLHTTGSLSRVHIALETGRTHQIRVQFAARGLPLVGERKYAVQDDPCELALWSYRLAFCHPRTMQPMTFSQEPQDCYPWSEV